MLSITVGFSIIEHNNYICFAANGKSKTVITQSSSPSNQTDGVLMTDVSG